MDEHMIERMEELWDTLLELSGDVIALETFCLSGKQCVADFGVYMCGAYIRRLRSDIDEHTGYLQQLSRHLLEDSTARVNL